VSLARTLILKVSDNTWLREHGTRVPFIRRAVSRFMPGESFDDMLAAARAQAGAGIAAVFTRLGENVTDRAEADAVAAHYLEGIARIRAEGLACEPSIKLTQLGLDIDREFAYRHALALARAAAEANSYFWVDMEQSPYVDVTLDIVRRLRAEAPAVGVCLQAYLRRTGDDLSDMQARGIGVRLVKGAYKEPATVAYPRKADVDARYFALAQQMVSPVGRARGSRAVFGTHDLALIDRIRAAARAVGAPPEACEFHMLYGIQRAGQLRLTADGAHVRVLIAYGSYWFPWYMRRLAERPANVWFVMRSLLG
jgi:proline dehydrogenase